MSFTLFIFVFFFVVLGIKPRDSPMVDKHTIIALCPQS
jgi:hypothetical protein